MYKKTLLKHVKHFYLFGDLVGFARFIEFKNSRKNYNFFKALKELDQLVRSDLLAEKNLLVLHHIDSSSNALLF